jgi:hypothetical protein
MAAALAVAAVSADAVAADTMSRTSGTKDFMRAFSREPTARDKRAIRTGFP